jgi:hypothetical protein
MLDYSRLSAREEMKVAPFQKPRDMTELRGELKKLQRE